MLKDDKIKRDKKNSLKLQSFIHLHLKYFYLLYLLFFTDIFALHFAAVILEISPLWE